jgi:RNA polymerase sigma-70 factor (ECF subfamily)
MPPELDPAPIELGQHLSQISTSWTVFFQAQTETGTAAASAQRQLLERYQSAVYRYLLASLGSRDAADEAFQEFALRLVRGDFRTADPARGRLRDFFKKSLYHLIVDHARRRGRQPQYLNPDAPEPATEESLMFDSDARFLAAWKAELMSRAWQGLADEERNTGRPAHMILRYRADHPHVKSEDLATHFSSVLGKPVTAVWIRKKLLFARERFTDLLVDEVSRSLENPAEGELEQELIHLELLEYCKPALDRREQKRGYVKNDPN